MLPPTLNKLIFGEKSILAIETSGTESIVNSITIDDLKNFYEKNFSPSLGKFIIAGDIDQARTEAALCGINTSWQSKEVTIPAVTLPEAPVKSQIYFVDVPGSKTISDIYRMPFNPTDKS